MKTLITVCLLALTTTALAKEEKAMRAPASDFARVKLSALKTQLGSGKFISIQVNADPDPNKEDFLVYVAASPSKKSVIVTGIAPADYYVVVQELCSQTAPMLQAGQGLTFHCFTK